jgi:chemotaxis signal transduction protein
MEQLLIFSAGGFRWAIPLAGVQSVIQMMDIIPVTGSGNGLAGEINLHGRILPVYSLAKHLGSDDHPPRLSDMLVIAHAGDENIALWIDDTRGVEELDISPAPVQGTDPERTGPPGISITTDGVIVITDLLVALANGPDAYRNKVPGLLEESAGASAVLELDTAGQDPGLVTAILRERAAKMFQPDPGTSVAETAEILRFQLAYQEYAIEMKYIREVILTGEITPVPGTPDFISGICAARGQIISLVDLRALFCIPEKGLTDLNRVIVMTNGEITFGILADTISGVATIALDHIVPPRPNELPGGRRFLKGSLGGTMFLLDGAAILGDPGIIVDDA